MRYQQSFSTRNFVFARSSWQSAEAQLPAEVANAEHSLCHMLIDAATPLHHPGLPPFIAFISLLLNTFKNSIIESCLVYLMFISCLFNKFLGYSPFFKTILYLTTILAPSAPFSIVYNELF
jgi:hypothetical protein